MNEPPGPPAFTIGAIEPSHRSRIAEILRSTENFRDEEVDVALEVFDAAFGGDDYVIVGAFLNRESGVGGSPPKAGGWESGVASERPIVQCPSGKFNVIGRSVEMAAQKFYTDANFGCRGKVQRAECERRLGIPRLSATKATQ